jgi:hypothetical protein
LPVTARVYLSQCRVTLHQKLHPFNPAAPVLQAGGSCDGAQTLQKQLKSPQRRAKVAAANLSSL